MSKKELIRRYCTFIVSVFIIAFGLSAVVRANLGVSPISSTPYVFSQFTPLSIGTYLFIICVLFIFLQIILLGKEESKKHKVDLLLQIPISFLFGLCTDLTMWVLTDLAPATYITRLITLVSGCAVLAIGICMEVQAGVAMMSPEYTVQVITKRSGKDFGTVKMFFDLSLITLAIISSLLFSGAVVGIREGTIIAAVITGPMVKVIMPRLRFINKWQQCTPAAESTEEINPAVLITISREYGSGGHAIGEMLASRLSIPFYDNKLVKMIADEGNFDEEYVRGNEQHINHSLYNMILQDYEAPLEKSMSPDDLLYVAGSKVINRIAAQGSCVIVGRCSSYILDKYPNNISVFLYADIEKKKARIVEKYGISPKDAAAQIKHIDKARSDHFYHYTGKRWGDSRSYQLCCDSGILSPEDICAMIEKLYYRALPKK